MMNKIVSLFVLILFVQSYLFAQADKFNDANQMKGKDVYVIDNSVLSVAYTMIDGKVKAVGKVKNMGISMSGKVYSVEREEYTYKKNNYLVLKGAKETILLKPEDAPLFLSSFVSKTYWQEKYNSYRNDYVYFDFKRYQQVHSAMATIEYDDLTRIEWRDYELSDNGAVFYMSEYNGIYPLDKFKVTSNFFEESKDLSFISKDSILPYIERYNARVAKAKREKEIADSVTNSKLRLAIALGDAKYDVDGRTINVYKDDTLAIFSYKASEDKYVARFHYGNLLFRATDIKFLDTKTTTTQGQYSWQTKTTETSADANFLKAKGEDGKEQRFEVATEYDEVHTEIWLGKLKAAIEDYNKEVAYKKKNLIFITGIGYVYDSNEYSNRFGMRFDIYNCFSKTIKYVELTLTNYNAVGDVQKDDMGRSSRTVRGIGPIEPEEGGRYSWDDIFWDDRDIIRKTRLTNVKFIFKDGTTRVFSGYTNINKHMSSDAWD